MSKVLPAECTANVVTVEGVPIPSAVVLSEGIAPSEGVLILDRGNAWYVASNATDLKTGLEKVSSVLNTIATTLTSIGAGMTGPTTAPPPTLPANVTAITVKATELQALSGNLK